MSGPSTHINYVSDNGTAYRALVPNWVATVTGDVAATATNGIPRGLARRHRYLRDPNGRRVRITVGSVTSPSWTAGFGVTVTPTPAPPGGAAGTWLYEGATGEVRRQRG